MGRLLVPLGTYLDVVSCVSAAFDVSASFELSRLLMIESNCYHSWSNFGSIWAATFTFVLLCSCSFLCISSCSLLCTSSYSFLCTSSCTFVWIPPKISDVAGGSLVSLCSGTSNFVIGVVANRSRGRVCNLYSISLLNSTNPSSLYFILASDLTWNSDSA